MIGTEPGGGSEAAELFPYAEDEGISASPSTIADLADTIEASGGSLDALSADVDVAHRPALTGTAGVLQSLTADAPKATKDNVSQVLAATLCAAGAARLFGENGVLAYNGYVDDLRAEYDERKAEIMASTCGVAEASYPKDATSSERTQIDSDHADEVATAREEQIAELVVELRERQAEYREDPLDAEADTAAARLEEGPTEETLKELFAAGALPSTTVDLFPDIHFTYDEIPSDLADMTDEELADYFLDHPDFDPNVLLNLENWRPEVVDLMGEKLADQIRDADITWDTDEETLKKYTDLLKTWQDANLDVTAALYDHLGAKDALTFLDKVGTIAYDGTSDDAEDLASTFRTGLRYADLLWDEDQRTEFGEDLGQAIEDNRADYPPRAFESALSYLLQDNYLSTELLDPLGDKLASMDNGARSWCNDGFSLPHESDLMAAYFSSLETNGEAALNFFDDPDRQEYYIGERHYQGTGMDSLLGALDSAVTDDANLRDSDRQVEAARLMSSVAEYLPDHSQASPDYVSGEGTVHLAHMLSTYMEAVSDGILDPEAAENRPGAFTLDENGFASPVFEQGELKSLVKLAVSSEDGIVAMREGVSAYQNLELSRDLADGQLTEAMLRQDARLEGWFMDAVGEQEIQGAEDKDKRIAAWIEMGKSLVGAIPLPGATAVGQLGQASLSFLAGQATNAGGSLFTDAFANSEKVEWTEQSQAAEAALETRQLMIAAQLADPGFELEPMISGDDLREAASGYSDEQVEEWFGSADNPTLPSQDEIAAMSQTERDQYEKVLKDVLADKLPEFENGDYQDTYKTQFQGYFDENFDD